MLDLIVMGNKVWVIGAIAFPFHNFFTRCTFGCHFLYMFDIMFACCST